jgi:hypothetical protein
MLPCGENVEFFQAFPNEDPVVKRKIKDQKYSKLGIDNAIF